MSPSPRLAGKIRRPQLRTQVLAGVLLVTLAALAVFDVTAVSELRRYLLNRTDSNLETVISLAQPVQVAVRTKVPGGVSIVATGRSAPPKQAARSVRFSAPHLKLRPAFLDQYYLAFVGRRGAPRVFIEGNPYLVPRRLHALGRVRSWRIFRTGVSGRGNTQLRLQARQVAGGILVRRQHQHRRRQQDGRPAQAHPDHRLDRRWPARRVRGRPRAAARAAADRGDGGRG